MSADDNAPEQAREVEVVRAVLANRPSVTYGVSNAVLDVIAADILAALAPVRAAERQEAARAALLDAADALSPGNGHALTIGAHSKSHVASNAVRYLRDRADGVTGRSGT